MSQAYPLQWPSSQARTKAYARWPNRRFGDVSVYRACDDIREEVRRLRGDGLVISSNIPLRVDGTPRSGMRRPDDPGVAVYFQRKGRPLVFACDKYLSPEHNLRAIALHLAALRGMERWGVGELDQVFTGYQALPEDSTSEPWWQTLGCAEPPRTSEALQAAYREAAKRAHPDKGGSDAAFQQLQRALEVGRKAIGAVA